jgi:hypothetical protein
MTDCDLCQDIGVLRWTDPTLHIAREHPCTRCGDGKPPTGARPTNPAPVGPLPNPPTCRYCGGGLTSREWRVIEHREDCGNPVVMARRARAAALAEAERVTDVEKP